METAHLLLIQQAESQSHAASTHTLSSDRQRTNAQLRDVEPTHFTNNAHVMQTHTQETTVQKTSLGAK